MKHLWAPWRFTYIKGKKSRRCVFCAGKRSEDRARYILYRSRTCFIIMNAFPYSNGHLLVAPYRHLQNLDRLNDAALADLMATTRRAIKALEKVYGPQGFNVGINLGKAAGAGIEEHLHVHIVPRWTGDTNFMSSVAGLRVIPEALDQAYDKLQKVLGAPRRSRAKIPPVRRQKKKTSR